MSEVELIQQIEEMRLFIKRLEQAHTIQMKNIKAMIMSESVHYLKKNCDKVVKMLTLEHHKLIQSFLAFKKRTAADIENAATHIKK